MTEDQHKDFLLYGCVSRAIMKVCGLDSTEDFCAAYEKWFRDEYYGMPNVNGIASSWQIWAVGGAVSVDR